MTRRAVSFKNNTRLGEDWLFFGSLGDHAFDPRESIFRSAKPAVQKRRVGTVGTDNKAAV